MYVVVRADLKPGMQVAQAVHAAFKFAYENIVITAMWEYNSNYLIVLNAENEEHLEKLAASAEESDVTVARFHEPDLDNSLTAIVLEPTLTAQKLCASLPLCLKGWELCK